MSPVYARVWDNEGEIDYPLEDAKYYESIGHFTFAGMRLYGDGIVELIYRFE